MIALWQIFWNVNGAQLFFQLFLVAWVLQILRLYPTVDLIGFNDLGEGEFRGKKDISRRLIPRTFESILWTFALDLDLHG
jgi:hypothetical protein